MRKTYKFRIYPTRKQKKALNKTLEACRWVYNKTLEYKKACWELYKRHSTYYTTTALLPRWKEIKPELNSVHSQILQDVQHRVDKAYKAFFRRVRAKENPGFPRFKGIGCYDSFTYTQSGFSIKDSKLRLSKIGDIKIVLHREIVGDIKQLTIKKAPTGKWYACFSVECDINSTSSTTAIIGIDVGIESFATLSTGEKILNPKFFRKSEHKLAKVQRRFSKSKNKKNRHSVAITHEQTANKRRDFAHKVSRNLVNNYRLIAFENLTITNMVKNHCLAKSIADASWGQLIEFTKYKAECAGSLVVTVNPRNTSKACSNCGCLVEKDLSVRVHECDCGLVMDRDQNAAINILRLGLQSLGLSIEAQ